jgi:succinate dehydrogenase/fumarate reductase cytochrome b subunit
LFWDAGTGYDLATLYRSGYMVIGFAAIATILSLIIA